MAIIEGTRGADEIVAASGSNLAFAFAVLSREKRRDMRILYAFCRVVDDIADSPGLEEKDRREKLDRWRSVSAGDATDLRDGLEKELSGLIGRYRLSPNLLHEIIAGVEMDFTRSRYDTIDSLKQYCYRVASAVGLASIEIFGYQDPGTRLYAETLGYAFQLTNILRDVGEDAAEDRIYLPIEDLDRFGLTEASIIERNPDDRFEELMLFECERAEGWYREAEAVLPEIDRRSMRAPELMRSIYSRILARMKGDGFRVFEKRYRLGKATMIWQLIRALAGS